MQPPTGRRWPCCLPAYCKCAGSLPHGLAAGLDDAGLRMNQAGVEPLEGRSIKIATARCRALPAADASMPLPLRQSNMTSSSIDALMCIKWPAQLFRVLGGVSPQLLARARVPGSTRSVETPGFDLAQPPSRAVGHFSTAQPNRDSHDADISGTTERRTSSAPSGRRRAALLARPAAQRTRQNSIAIKRRDRRRADSDSPR